MIQINLSKLLFKRKMSQAELARRSSVRPATINAYYNNYVERMNKSDIDKICAALDCRIEDLLEYKKKPD